MAGCLPLTSCELTDQVVQLEAIVSLLPLTLQTLKVKGTYEGSINLFVFQRLRNLQALDLDIGEIPRNHIGSCFFLCRQLASLQKLMLVSRPFLMGYSPTLLLPNLQCICVDIDVY